MKMLQSDCGRSIDEGKGLMQRRPASACVHACVRACIVSDFRACVHVMHARPVGTIHAWIGTTGWVPAGLRSGAAQRNPSRRRWMETCRGVASAACCGHLKTPCPALVAHAAVPCCRETSLPQNAESPAFLAWQPGGSM